VLLEDIRAPDEAARIASRLLDIFVQPFQAEGREPHITASIGISLFPDHGSGIDTLLANADVAMYQPTRNRVVTPIDSSSPR
jgi:GGDEF domain-containing protein